MPITHTITASDAEIVAAARKGIKDKNADRRLRAVQMRGESKKNKEIAKILETSTVSVSTWISLYKKGGISALLPKPKTGRPTTLSREKEAALLEGFKQQAAQGIIIEIGQIKAAYETMVGHPIGGSQIYYVLARHGWRKVMPRSKHPNKASDEAIEASKKLTIGSER
jgi:transposase